MMYNESGEYIKPTMLTFTIEEEHYDESLFFNGKPIKERIFCFRLSGPSGRFKQIVFDRVEIKEGETVKPNEEARTSMLYTLVKKMDEQGCHLINSEEYLAMVLGVGRLMHIYMKAE